MGSSQQDAAEHAKQHPSMGDAVEGVVPPGLESLESDRAFNALWENAPDAMYLCDAGGTFLYGNAATEALTGYARDSLVGHSFLEPGLLSPDDISKAAALLAENAAGHATGPDEFVLNCKDGTQTCVEIRSKPISIGRQSLILGIARDVRARKELENKLRLLSAVAEQSPVAVAISDVDGIIEYANSRLSDLVAKPLAEILGMRWFEQPSVFPFLREHSSEIRSSVFERKDIWHADSRQADAAGNVQWLRHMAFPIVNERDEISHVVFMNEDVTERVRAEEALEASEFQYAALVNSTTDGIVIIQDAVLRFVNPASFALLGYLPDELIGKPFIQYVAKEAQEEVIQRLKDRVAGKDVPGFYELKLVKKDGTLLPVEINASRLAYRGGVAVLAFLRDITKRKRVETSLRESEERHRKLVEQSLMGIAVTQRDKVVFANPALVRIFGYDTFEQSAKTSLLDHIAPSSRDRVVDLMRRIQEDELPVYDFECDVLRGDGTLRTVRASASRLHLDTGTYTQTVFEDVTERKRVEQDLRTSEAQLSNALRMAHAGHWEYDVASDTFTFNDNFYSIFHTTASEIGSYKLSSAEYARRFCHPDDMHMVGAEVQAAIATDNPYYSRELQHRILYADGTVGYIAVRFFVTKDSQGRTVKTYGVNQDITERIEAEKRVRDALEGTIQAVAETIEARDPYTAGHQRRVTKLAVAIAQRLNLPSERVEGIRVAAALHDIGKMSTPAEILSKPGKLSKQEFDLLRQHPRVAHDILEGIPFPWPVENIVLQHHERLDGSGYPDGLEGNDILIEARIIAVADTVEAMSSHRPYRPALGLGEALHEIREYSGTRYDPEVVAACVDLFENTQFSLDSQEPAATSTTGG